MDKQSVVYMYVCTHTHTTQVHTGMLLSIKKIDLMKHAITWMNLENYAKEVRCQRLHIL